MIALFRAALVAVAALAAIVPQRGLKAAGGDGSASESVVIAGSVTKSVIQNIVNKQNPATLAILAKALSDKNISEEHRHQAEAEAAKLARQLDLSNVTTQAVVGFLRVLGRQPDLKLEEVPAKMAEITANYLQMQARLAALSPQDPTATDLVRQAAEAGKAGRFEEADRLLEQAEAREAAAVEKHQIKVAELRAARGDNAATQLHYADAARHYEAASAELPPGASDKKAVYLAQAGDMWWTSGNSTAALTSYRADLTITERLAKADPGNAGWQRDLSVSQERIGDVQQAQGDLAAALTSYRAGARRSGSVWRKRTPATPAGSATSRSRRTGSATCSRRRATWRRR